jgi:hypothetical protein
MPPPCSTSASCSSCGASPTKWTWRKPPLPRGRRRPPGQAHALKHRLPRREGRPRKARPGAGGLREAPRPRRQEYAGLASAPRKTSPRRVPNVARRAAWPQGTPGMAPRVVPRELGSQASNAPRRGAREPVASIRSAVARSPWPRVVRRRWAAGRFAPEVPVRRWRVAAARPPRRHPPRARRAGVGAAHPEAPGPSRGRRRARLAIASARPWQVAGAARILRSTTSEPCDRCDAPPHAWTRRNSMATHAQAQKNGRPRAAVA